MTKCWLKRKQSFTEKQCCCVCSKLLIVTGHPSSDGTSLDNHKGFACGGFAHEGYVIDQWPQHSIGCEMFSRKLDKPTHDA